MPPRSAAALLPVEETPVPQALQTRRPHASVQSLHPAKPVKSPLRYPGGKSRAVGEILRLLPPGLTRMCSPFAGGASLELACAARGITVQAYDVFEPLVNFWNVLMADAPALAQLARAYLPLSRACFYELQREYTGIKNDAQRAAAFYVLNRASFSGTTLSGGMSPGHPRFTESGLARMAAFRVRGFSVARAGFAASIPRHQGDFLYLDPPYANGGKLYGAKGSCHTAFDHAALAALLRARGCWLLSYNDCDVVRDLYRGFAFRKAEWAYGMNNSRKSNEVFIFSRDYGLE